MSHTEARRLQPNCDRSILGVWHRCAVIRAYTEINWAQAFNPTSFYPRVCCESANAPYPAARLAQLPPQCTDSSTITRFPRLRLSLLLPRTSPLCVAALRSPICQSLRGGSSRSTHSLHGSRITDAMAFLRSRWASSNSSFDCRRR
jgi:hypothetical protein